MIEKTISKFGLLLLDRNINNISIKSKGALNSTVASQDVSINGSYTLRRKRDGSFPDNPRQFAEFSTLTVLPTPPEQLPTITQKSGICQILPFLHAIQSQLNWKMDYESFWHCLPENLTPNPFYNTSIGYRKLYHLLFSNQGTCFSAYEIPKNCEGFATQSVGDSSRVIDCNNQCNRSIKITTQKLPPINSEQDLCDRLNNFGPVVLESRDIMSRRLLFLMWEVANGGQYNTWESVKDIDYNTIKSLYPSIADDSDRLDHALTIVSCTDGIFKVINSWEYEQELNLSWEDLDKYFIIRSKTETLYFPGTTWGIPVGSRVTTYPVLPINFYPFVEECSSSADAPECKAEKCKQAGYDGFIESEDPDDCECYCEDIAVPDVAFPTDEPINPKPLLPCLNIGEIVPRIVELRYTDPTTYTNLIKKCVCPEHPQPDKFYYQTVITEDGQQVCCERAIQGSSSGGSDEEIQSFIYNPSTKTWTVK